LAQKYGTVISLGASFRSANIFDSFDAAQRAELQMQITLAAEIFKSGVGVIVESPGHARPSDIRKVSSVLRGTGLPIMPLGPIPTDVAVGEDHVAAAIGATLMGLDGCAHILAAVTREEHTGGIPSITSTTEAVIAARIAGHILDLELLGDDRADKEISGTRSSNRTCIAGSKTRGCPRCGQSCPL
jgi:phosphomethylpyrimidine synthase